ncbi:tRNA-uridine aminocarboxypropyltransferase [Bdellovibrionota bacterium FG-1]
MEFKILQANRVICRKCRRAVKACDCSHIKPFASGPRFVILIHPKENRKRVGTGRLTHLCITNSVLVEGVDFSTDPVVQQIVQDSANWPVVLYPGPQAMDLTENAGGQLEALVPAGKNLVIFILDGTWFCAQKMLKVSTNLRQLPQIMFTPPHPSIYQFRRQPHALCFSSIEAVHVMIERLNESPRWRSAPGHDSLLEMFQRLIDRQLSHVKHFQQRAVRGKRG